MSTVQKPQSKIKTLIFIALCAAIMCILGPISFPLPFSPVPISLGVLAVLIAAYILGPFKGLAACAVYILIGMTGFPVFSGFKGGFGVLAGPTGGYIIGYFFVVLFSGLFIRKFESKRLLHLTGIIIGLLLCYLIGTLWLAKFASLGFLPALMAGVIPYLPADAVKVIIVQLIGPKLRNAVKNLN